MNDSECGISPSFESFRCVLYTGYKDRTPLGARKGSATAQGPKTTATRQEQGTGVAMRDLTGSCQWETQLCCQQGTTVVTPGPSVPSTLLMLPTHAFTDLHASY